MVWWFVGLAVVIAALAIVLHRRGTSWADSDGMRDAGAPDAPEAFRARPEGMGGMSGGGSGS
jgi:hypothetical protein